MNGDNTDACPGCGLQYVHDSPSDRRYHYHYHDNAVNGPRTKLGDGIYFVSPRSNQRMRNLVYRAAQLARRETKYDFPAFDPWEKYDPESDTVAVISIEQGRVVGLIVTRNRPCRYCVPLAEFADDAIIGWRPTNGSPKHLVEQSV